MSRQTHWSGQHTVEKRFILCLGMQEVSNPLTCQGRLSRMKWCQGIIFNLSECPREHCLFLLPEIHTDSSLRVSHVYSKSQWQLFMWSYSSRERKVFRELRYPVMASNHITLWWTLMLILVVIFPGVDQMSRLWTGGAKKKKKGACFKSVILSSQMCTYIKTWWSPLGHGHSLRSIRNAG